MFRSLAAVARRAPRAWAKQIRADVAASRAADLAELRIQIPEEDPDRDLIVARYDWSRRKTQVWHLGDLHLIFADLLDPPR